MTRLENPVEATRRLREEHQVISKVLDCFDIALGEAREAGALDGPIFEKFVDFFRGFADQCHHCKEEDRLFPVLVSAGIPNEGGPIGCMLAEHEQARAFVRAIAERLEAAGRGDGAAINALIEHGEMFIDLMRNHIAKENNVLFNMADGILDESQIERLSRSYDDAEAQPEYCARLARSRVIADVLMDRYGVGAP